MSDPGRLATKAPAHTVIVQPVWRRNLAVMALIMNTFMGTLDGSIVNVALPRMSLELGVSPSSAVWVATAFLLAVACGVPATCALGDQIGRRRLFLIGVPLFTLSSLGCALSPDLSVLIVCRVLQGLGTAVVLAVTLPLLRAMFSPRRLGSILGINAMTVAIGTCAGPVLGGLILSVAAWPWLFLINVPIGVVAFFLGLYAVPAQPPDPGDFDWLGSLLAGVAIVAFLLAVHEVADVSTLWRGGVLLLVCAGLVVAFLRRERVARRPVIPLDMWNGLFSLSVTTAMVAFFGQGIAIIALPFLFQSAYGASPLQSALLFTPWPAVIMLVAPISGRLADRLRPSVLALVGLSVYLAGLVIIAMLGLHPPIWLVLCASALGGLGFGVFQSPNNKEMQGSTPMRYASSAAAVLNLNRNVAQSIGAGAVSVALVLSGAASGSLAQQAQASMRVLWVAVAAAAVAVVISATKLRHVARIDQAE